LKNYFEICKKSFETFETLVSGYKTIFMMIIGERTILVWLTQSNLQKETQEILLKLPVYQPVGMRLEYWKGNTYSSKQYNYKINFEGYYISYFELELYHLYYII